jgi:hypothetical protein
MIWNILITVLHICNCPVDIINAHATAIQNYFSNCFRSSSNHDIRNDSTGNMRIQGGIVSMVNRSSSTTSDTVPNPLFSNVSRDNRGQYHALPQLSSVGEKKTNSTGIDV